jgi:AcrR family transcriptional regulator
MTDDEGRVARPDSPASPPAKRPGPRDRLIIAAARLFAQNGFEAVSLRQIGTAAGQRNTNAVRYHFGTKERLIEAIFERHQARLESVRRAMLDSIPSPRGPEAIGTLLAIIVLPPFAIADEEERYNYIKLISEYLNRQRDSGMRHPLDYATELLPALVEARDLLRSLLGLPDEIFDFRTQMVVGMAFQAVIQRRVRLASGLPCPSEQVLIDDIMAMVGAAMQAERGAIAIPNANLRDILI